MTGPCRHKWVRMFPELPTLGCLHCGQHGELAKPTPEQAYDLLRDMGVKAEEAARRSGYIPERLKEK